MLRKVLIACWLLVPGPAAWAVAEEPPDQKDDPAAVDRNQTPAEMLAAIEREFRDAQAAFREAYQKAKTDAERRTIIDVMYPQPEKYIEQFMALAKEHPDDPAAFTALSNSISYGRGSPLADEAVQILADKHIQDERLASVCMQLVYNNSPAADQLLRAAAESPHREVQGQASFALAMRLHGKGERLVADDPEGAKEASAEAEKLFEQIAADFKDVESYQGTLADMADKQLFEIRHLSIGKQAPDIEGEDIDGGPFKLSEYRGRVVVLDFWGNW